MISSVLIGNQRGEAGLLICIDESGCPGFKPSSTPYFVVAMVIFADDAEAERTSGTISRVRDHLKVKPEFKFSKCSKEVRTAFFANVADHRFSIRALVVDKARIYSPHLRSKPEQFYNFFLQNLMRHNQEAIRNASIKIDGSGDRRFKEALSAYLRKELREGTIRKIRFANSRTDNLIQLADMVAGAIARSYPGRGRESDARWRRMLRSRIHNVWDFK